MKKTKIKHINIPIFNRTFVLSQTKEYTSEVMKYYGYINTEPPNSVLGRVSELAPCIYLLSVFNGELSVLQHEITHLATMVLDNGDSYDFRGNDENLAYLIGYLTEVIYKEWKIPLKFNNLT
jgi:hypothetical protein